MIFISRTETTPMMFLVMVIVLFQFQNVVEGKVFKFNTTSNHLVITDSDIDIRNSSFLRFSVHACYDQLLRLGSIGHQATNSYFLEIVLNHKYIGIRDNCESCTVSKIDYFNTFNCSKTFRFWMSWTEPGVVKLGTDYDIGQNVVRRYQAKSVFNVDFITLRSYYKPGYWTVIKDDLPEVAYPDPHGITTVYLNESTPVNFTIMDVLVTDPENDSISIYLLSHTHLFEVNNKSLILKGALDYETTTAYNMTMNITDGLNSVYVSLTIIILDVIDEPPSISVIGNFQLEEELAPGTEVFGFYNVTDGDDGDTFQFFLEGVDSEKFEINIDNGSLIVKDRIDRESLNSTDQLGTMVITVVDSAGLSGQAAFNITITDINDNPPQCVVSPDRVTVYEDQAIEALDEYNHKLPLANISCTDKDSPNITNFTYSVISPEYFINVSRFENDTLFGNQGAFDLEILRQDNISVIIQINDTIASVQGNSAYQILVIEIVSVNEYEPKFNESEKVITMWSTIEPGQVVGTVYAYDADWGADGLITYAMSSESFVISEYIEGMTSVGDLLSIHPTTGDISLKDFLDKHTNINFFMTFQAVDDAPVPKRAFLEISFVIKDASTYWPTIETELVTMSVSCYQPLNASILRVGIANPDSTVPVVFAMEQNFQEQFFLINETTGDVCLVHRPTRCPLRTVSKVFVANPLAPTKASSGFLILEFGSEIQVDSTTDRPKQTYNITRPMSNEAALDTPETDIQSISLMVVCGVETFLLIVIGICFIKAKKCNKSDVHPRANSGSNVSVATSQAKTVSTRCSSVESLSLV